MQLSRPLLLLALLLAPVALIGTTWLYLYPLFDAACSFPASSNGTAPFRLLALGDPQLEGDSSLPKAGTPIFRSFENLVEHIRDAESVSQQWELVQEAVKGVPKDARKALEGYIRKPLDIWGNDFYLAHIVRTLRWWTKPSHVAVLGDLLGSQWVKDEEFERRANRYWDVVFRGMEKVPDSIMVGDTGDEGEDVKWGGTREVLGADEEWDKRLINIAGNHDVGYAGDIDDDRIERFERRFGMVNWDIVFTLPRDEALPEEEQTPELRLVTLNSMNLDTPAYSEDLQRETYDFLNHVVATARPVTDKTHATILLTHIPLVKQPGICVDSPFFAFFDSGGVKEQNMLSEHASKVVLESLFGLSGNPDVDGQGFGRHGIIINGHDHAGCDILHFTTQPGVEIPCPGQEEALLSDQPLASSSNASSELPLSNSLEAAIVANETISEAETHNGQEHEAAHEGQASGEEPQEIDNDNNEDEDAPTWHALRYPPPPTTNIRTNTCIPPSAVPHIREVTLRSMMGEFSGYAGFLSAWFDSSLGEKGEWRLEMNTCGLGVQHWWWAVHIVDAVFAVATLLGAVIKVHEIKETRRREAAERNKQRRRRVEGKGN